MYTHGARTLGARVRPPKHKQKGQWCKQEDASPQRVMFSRLRDLALLKKSSLSLSLSLFSRVGIRVPPLLVPFTFSALCLGHIPWVGQRLFYISYTLLGHTLWMLAISDLLSRCVIALCMMYAHIYIYIYMPACVWVIVHFVWWTLMAT